jgi:hypothetical protein
MTQPMLMLFSLTLRVRERARRDERGDVPGWVLITVMTAGLVAALWAIAGPQLSQMLRDALRSVRG